MAGGPGAEMASVWSSVSVSLWAKRIANGGPRTARQAMASGLVCVHRDQPRLVAAGPTAVMDGSGTAQTKLPSPKNQRKRILLEQPGQLCIRCNLQAPLGDGNLTAVLVCRRSGLSQLVPWSSKVRCQGKVPKLQLALLIIQLTSD